MEVKKQILTSLRLNRDDGLLADELLIEVFGNDRRKAGEEEIVKETLKELHKEHKIVKRGLLYKIK